MSPLLERTRGVERKEGGREWGKGELVPHQISNFRIREHVTQQTTMLTNTPGGVPPWHPILASFPECPQPLSHPMSHHSTLTPSPEPYKIKWHLPKHCTDRLCQGAMTTPGLLCQCVCRTLPGAAQVTKQKQSRPKSLWDDLRWYIPSVMQEDKCVFYGHYASTDPLLFLSVALCDCPIFISIFRRVGNILQYIS